MRLQYDDVPSRCRQGQQSAAAAAAAAASLGATRRSAHRFCWLGAQIVGFCFDDRVERLTRHNESVQEIERLDDGEAYGGVGCHQNPRRAHNDAPRRQMTLD